MILEMLIGKFKKYYTLWLLLILVFIMLPCSSVKASEITIDRGKATKLFNNSMAHTKDGEDYEIRRIGFIKDGWEVSIANHNGNGFDLHSVGFGYVWNYSWHVLYTDFGVGLRLTEKDRDNRWTCHKALIADFSGSVGVQYKNFKAGYRLRHFSAPGDDPGMNVDSVFFNFDLPF